MLYLRPKNKSGCFTDASSTFAWISLISIPILLFRQQIEQIQQIFPTS